MSEPLQQMEAASKLLELKNIDLSFGGVKAISNISFDVMEGEVRAIIGPNGAGKSSLLNVINGFYHPQQGEIWFDGKQRHAMKPYQIAYPQLSSRPLRIDTDSPRLTPPPRRIVRRSAPPARRPTTPTGRRQRHRQHPGWRARSGAGSALWRA